MSFLGENSCAENANRFSHLFPICVRNFSMTFPPFQYLLLVLFVLPLSRVQAQSSKQYPTVASRKAFFTDLASKHNSKSIQLILESDSDNSFETYLRGNSEKELLESYDVVVHELLHGYNSINPGNGSYSYFLGPGQWAEVSMTEVFSSRKLNQFVRRGLQDSIFRYGLYVGGKRTTVDQKGASIAINNGTNDLFSIEKGIFGLLDEYSAYYFGTLATWELFAYYKERYGEDAEDAWSDYKHSLLGNATAYHEFRLFISWYLRYAKKNHPEVHEELLANHSLRKTFTKVDGMFGDLMRQIEGAIPELNRLGGIDIATRIAATGTDDDIRAFLAENDMNPDEMGIKPGSPEWETLRKQYLKIVKEMKSAIPNNIEYFYSQPLAQWEMLKQEFNAVEQQTLANFRMAP